jgi:hypothetical protein
MNYSTFAPCTSFAGFNSAPTTKWADDSASLEESRLVQQYLKLAVGEPLAPPPATRVPSFTVHMATKYVVEPALLPLGPGAYLPPGYFASLPTPPPPTPVAVVTAEPAELAKPFGDWVTPSAVRAQRQREADSRRAFREREAKREQARLEAELARKRAETARRRREAQARKNGVSAAALAAQRRADARAKSSVA